MEGSAPQLAGRYCGQVAFDRRSGRFGTGGVYVNFAGLEGEAGASSTFGASAARLDAIRADYDPDGLFTAAAARP